MPGSFMPAYQIPLQIRLNDNATFDNYLVKDNAQALELLNSDERFVYLWSAAETGKTHLLQAACHRNENSFYLPLKELTCWQPTILEGLESYQMVCLDDIHCVAGFPEWEEAMFDLFNRLNESQRRLLVTANCSPASLGMELADLASRLSWGVAVRLHPLTDKDKVTALRMRASARGINLGEDVVAYLMKHCPRDMHTLFAILDKLDDASLQAKRRVSIPFIKQCLDDFQ